MEKSKSNNIEAAWDPTVLVNETDLNIPNIDEDFYYARSLDIGEKVPNALLRKCSGTVMNVMHHCH